MTELKIEADPAEVGLDPERLARIDAHFARYVDDGRLPGWLIPAVEPMRIWHLLTHTAGLTYGFHRSHPVDALYRAAGFEWGTPPGVDLAQACDMWAGLPLLFQPGTEWNYSVATDVLGRVVEVASGQRFDEFLAARIFRPLGMTPQTAFWADQQAESRLAALYTPDRGGKARRADSLGKGALAAAWTWRRSAGRCTPSRRSAASASASASPSSSTRCRAR